MKGFAIFIKKILYLVAISYNGSVAAHHAANLIHHIMAIVSHFVCKTRKLFWKKVKRNAKISNKFKKPTSKGFARLFFYLVQFYEQRIADFGPQVTRPVAFSRNVFGEQNVACVENPFLANRSLDLYRTVEQDDVLPVGCVVEIIIVIGCDFSEHDCGRLLRFRQQPDGAVIVQRDFNILELAVAVQVFKNAGNFIGIHLRVF